MTEHTIYDRFDVIQFEGELIGHASTRKSDKQDRWTNIDIYKTTTGKYVIHRLGCSVRYHLPEEKCTSGKAVRGLDLDLSDLPCPDCNPETPGEDDWDEDLEFYQEVTMSSADVVDNAADIRKSLVITNKKTGKEFLSSVAYSALQEAVRSDKSLLGVFERRINV